MMLTRKPRLHKMIGLRNMVTNGKEWKYLIFYEVDNPTEADIRHIIEYMDYQRVSYIMYSTKAGMHVVGLTPVNAMKWASMYNALQGLVPEYYSGQTIRLSRKIGENQELIYYNLDYPFMTNLLDIYKKRFFEELFLAGLNDPRNIISESEWHLVFLRYWSYKK